MTCKSGHTDGTRCETCKDNAELVGYNCDCKLGWARVDDGPCNVSLTAAHINNTPGCSGSSPDGTQCASCQSATNWILDPDTHLCECQIGFWKNGSTCDSCTDSIPNCLECSSNSLCTKCNQTEFWQLGSGKCDECQTPNYALEPPLEKICKPCKDLMTGCKDCTNANTCTAC